jgi:hypothetical protein
MITLQTVPVDLLLNIGTYLQDTHLSKSDNINEVTLAVTLKDYEMLEHYMKKHRPSDVIQMVALSGNLKVLKWVVKKGCPLDESTFHEAARSRWYSGFAERGVHGTNGYVQLQLGMEIWRCYSGCIVKAVHGTRIHVAMQLGMEI